jgi:hypothetical protein
VVLVTCSGKQALLELDRETLAIDPANYDRVYFERQAVGFHPQTDDSSQWATWTEPDGTVVTVAADQLREHETGRAGPKPGRNFAEWWSAGSDGKFLDEAIANIRNAATRGRVPD